MALKKRPGTNNWWVAFQHKGRLYQKSSGTTSRREAEAFERRWRSEVEAAVEVALAPTLTVLRDLDVARMREEGRNERYITAGVIHNYRALMVFFPDTRAVTEDSLVAYVKHRRAQGVRRQTISKELTVLRRGFRLARLTPPTYWPKLSRDAPDVRLASKQHELSRWRAWLAALDGEARDVALFALLTGLRSGELYRVQPGDVVSNVLTVREKVKRPAQRRVVLSPSALGVVPRLPFQADHKGAHAKASRATGKTNVTLRDCRAAFATAGDLGGDSRATDMAMGHSGIPARYQKSDLERLARVAAAVERWLLGESVQGPASPITLDSPRDP